MNEIEFNKPSECNIYLRSLENGKTRVSMSWGRYLFIKRFCELYGEVMGNRLAIRIDPVYDEGSDVFDIKKDGDVALIIEVDRYYTSKEIYEIVKEMKDGERFPFRAAGKAVTTVRTRIAKVARKCAIKKQVDGSFVAIMGGDPEKSYRERLHDALNEYKGKAIPFANISTSTNLDTIRANVARYNAEHKTSFSVYGKEKIIAQAEDVTVSDRLAKSEISQAERKSDDQLAIIRKALIKLNDGRKISEYEYAKVKESLKPLNELMKASLEEDMM